MKETFLRLGDPGSPAPDRRRKRSSDNGAKPRRLTPKERQLTTREREILRFLAFGMGTSAIAKELSISPATVRNHAQRILAKLQVHSRLAAVARGYAIGLLPSPQWRPAAAISIEPPVR
ncbi:MAG TPA: LuxR C-terminal-related transcriptional regulator [Thermoanaerobaculia bacterium]|nr:LuxR C-terminal-related transcriptional regulator [Thermoanaerobaculia bacterium]